MPEGVNQAQLDPTIASIVVNGCPLGHSTEQMTIGELHNNPELRHVLAEPLKNIDVLVNNGLEREQAIGIALGGFALRSAEGTIIRTQEAPTDTNPPTQAGSEKKYTP